MSEDIKNVKLSFSCSENWEAMTDAAGGKHCDKCQKKVYDFTNSKANEFIKILADNNYNVCGRFSTAQVASAPIIMPLWKKWLSAAMVLVGINLFGCKGTNNQTLVGDTVMLPSVNTTQSNSVQHNQTVRPNEPVCTISRSKLIEGDVCTSVDELPNFPGGENIFFKFVNTNLKYPADANGITGRIIVTFVVNRDGSLNNFKLVGRKLHPALEKEALRVMKKSPKWTPGKIKGKAVRTQYTVPIIFN